jgi:hypothetical protein
LSEHPADRLLEELEAVEREVEQWRVAIARVVCARRCEADDEYWYL